ncbi:hypothetical protein AVEN_239977-1 [Araneus ventricosus]|uniref:Uncharacterized protein n=1 Tax=Araneus ventricosus TaxID=182803 RepID=A0A4Y2S428_ARAVE|nr:hypothetical protein AVEN_239977-1 [Araneus ventricosus]
MNWLKSTSRKWSICVYLADVLPEGCCPAQPPTKDPPPIPVITTIRRPLLTSWSTTLDSLSSVITELFVTPNGRDRLWETFVNSRS